MDRQARTCQAVTACVLPIVQDSGAIAWSRHLCVLHSTTTNSSVGSKELSLQCPACTLHGRPRGYVAPGLLMASVPLRPPARFNSAFPGCSWTSYRHASRRLVMPSCRSMRCLGGVIRRAWRVGRSTDARTIGSPARLPTSMSPSIMGQGARHAASHLPGATSANAMRSTLRLAGARAKSGCRGVDPRPGSPPPAGGS